jgi:hypothetical protein
VRLFLPVLWAVWIADAHRDDGKRYVVHTDEILTAFTELELATRAGVDCLDELI